MQPTFPFTPGGNGESPIFGFPTAFDVISIGPMSEITNQRYYDLVASELQARFIRPGLWARAVAETGTEGAQARALYIRLRVLDLIAEENAEREKAEAARVAARVRQEEQALLDEKRANPNAWQAPDF